MPQHFHFIEAKQVQSSLIHTTRNTVEVLCGLNRLTNKLCLLRSKDPYTCKYRPLLYIETDYTSYFTNTVILWQSVKLTTDRFSNCFWNSESYWTDVGVTQGMILRTLYMYGWERWHYSERQTESWSFRHKGDCWCSVSKPQTQLAQQCDTLYTHELGSLPGYSPAWRHPRHATYQVLPGPKYCSKQHWYAKIVHTFLSDVREGWTLSTSSYYVNICIMTNNSSFSLTGPGIWVCTRHMQEL